MLGTSAPGPEIGLPGRILAGRHRESTVLFFAHELINAGSMLFDTWYVLDTRYVCLIGVAKNRARIKKLARGMLFAHVLMNAFP
jgi:hypothetical protein